MGYRESFDLCRTFSYHKSFDSQISEWVRESFESRFTSRDTTDKMVRKSFESNRDFRSRIGNHLIHFAN